MKMRVLRVRNVAEALPIGVEMLLGSPVSESRAGLVHVYHEPVTTVYENPTERVVTNPIRDANPFFHLVESMWMLQGRDDVGLLNRFVKDFGDRFADNGVIHGSYGHRWRRAFGFDQLKVVIEKLQNNPDDRQCVIQMWDARLDSSGQSSTNDLQGTWKDRPCNTHVYLRVREVENESPMLVLDMTVCCRSNDIVLGAYGANAVHFSFLQEYIASMIGVGVGTYYQISNNYHVYEAELQRLESRRLRSPEHRDLTLVESLASHGVYPVDTSVPLVSDPEKFDEELGLIMRLYEHAAEVFDRPDAYRNNLINFAGLHNPFLSGTLLPMMMAHLCWRHNEKEAVAGYVDSVEDEAWQVAAHAWIERRAK
jgi:thymidylate synthase